MKLVIQAERRAAPGSHIIRTPKLEEAIEALKADGWKVTFLESGDWVYLVSDFVEGEPPPPPPFSVRHETLAPQGTDATQ